MGGRGSGREGSCGFLVDKTDDYHAVDLAWLSRQSSFKLGYCGTIRWSRGGNQTGWIQYRIELSGLRLIYRARSGDDEWQEVNEIIRFANTEAQFGGRRLWLECPSCQRRCRIIYGGARFRCRRCYQLKYQSQYEPPFAGASNRAHTIRERLGHRGGLDDPFPRKPKGMHWKTYRRLETEDDRLQRQWAMGISGWLNRLEKPDG